MELDERAVGQARQPDDLEDAAERAEVGVVLCARGVGGNHTDAVSLRTKALRKLHCIVRQSVAGRRVGRDDQCFHTQSFSDDSTRSSTSSHLNSRSTYSRPRAAISRIISGLSSSSRRASVNSYLSPYVSPAPERSQCQRSTSLCALAMTGVPASHASSTVREKLSLADGCTYALAAAKPSERSPSDTNPRSTTWTLAGTRPMLPTPQLTRGSVCGRLSLANDNPSTNSVQPFIASRRPA